VKYAALNAMMPMSKPMKLAARSFAMIVQMRYLRNLHKLGWEHKTMKILLKTGILIIAIGTAYSGIKAGEWYQGTIDLKTTQATAIEHGCGQYNPKSAAFEWLDATVPPVDMAQLGVLPMHPTPVRKPKP